MTLYLLDVQVLQEMRPGGHADVWAWAASVDDSDLRLSAITCLEKRMGWENKRRDLIAKGQDTSQADAALRAFSELENEYADRIIPIDAAVSAEWARLLGAKRNNTMDMALAASARVHGLVLVTRNRKDFVGRGVTILDPFKKNPRPEAV